MTKIQNQVKEIIDSDFYEVPAEVSETEAIIYDWIAHTYGEREASNPSWNIHELAEYLDKMRETLDNTKCVYKPSLTVKYEL